MFVCVDVEDVILCLYYARCVLRPHVVVTRRALSWASRLCWLAGPTLFAEAMDNNQLTANTTAIATATTHHSLSTDMHPCQHAGLRMGNMYIVYTERCLRETVRVCTYLNCLYSMLRTALHIMINRRRLVCDDDDDDVDQDWIETNQLSSLDASAGRCCACCRCRGIKMA